MLGGAEEVAAATTYADLRRLGIRHVDGGRGDRGRLWARTAGELLTFGTNLSGELGNRGARDRAVEFEAVLYQGAEFGDFAARRAPGPTCVGVFVPSAREAGEVGAAAVAMRGEHRTDSARAGIDVGADDDAVGADAAQHRLLGVER